MLAMWVRVRVKPEGREVKMGALEELDDPGARQPEREVTEHPTSVVRKNCGPSRIPLEGS